LAFVEQDGPNLRNRKIGEALRVQHVYHVLALLFVQRPRMAARL